MKILFLSAAKSIHTVKWVNAFAERGHEVYLISIKGHEPKENTLHSNIKFYQLRYGGTLGYYMNAHEFSKLVKKIKPDVINVHYASGYGTLARISNISHYILSIWGSDVYDFPYESRLKNYILKKNVKKAEMLASTSECMANQLRKVMGNEKLEIAITPFGVDLNLFDPSKYPKDDNDDFVVGTVKALESKYGIYELILAFDKLKKHLEEKDNWKKNLKLITLWARMASAMPGTSRSATSRVASGVTSRSERPEPPQVSTMSASVLSQASMSAPAMNGRSSISTTRRTHSQPCSAMSCSSFCPASSVSKVRVSEHVMMANLMVMASPRERLLPEYRAAGNRRWSPQVEARCPRA